MRKSRYTEEQITSAIKASENGIKVKEICDELGISEATFYSWKRNTPDCPQKKEGKSKS